jgi:hypothetical protein
MGLFLVTGACLLAWFLLLALLEVVGHTAVPGSQEWDIHSIQANNPLCLTYFGTKVAAPSCRRGILHMGRYSICLILSGSRSKVG